MTTQNPAVCAGVLVVSQQRQTLRHLSRFLQVFGYSVIEASDPAQAEAAFETALPEIVIIDWGMSDGGGRELCQRIRRSRTNPTCFVFMLTESRDPHEMLGALKAGVDDYLRVPLVYGELLARLRAASRTVAQLRRERAYLATDLLTGLHTRSALERRLDEQIEAASPGHESTLAVFDVDFFHRVNRQLGRPAGDELLLCVAGKLRDAASEAFVARLEDDRFAVLVDGDVAESVDAWANRLRSDLASCDFQGSTICGPITLSAGVARQIGGEHAVNDLLARAEEALASAKQSGRDCLVRAGEHDEESKTWRDLAVRGNLFKRTVARDVMTPCALMLPAGAAIGEAHHQLKRSGLRIAPVVNHATKLVGIVSEAAAAAAVEQGESGPVSKLVDRVEVNCFDEDSSFRELFDFFVEGTGETVSVVRDGTPVGLISRQDLAALIEPMTTQTETTNSAASDTSVEND